MVRASIAYFVLTFAGSAFCAEDFTPHPASAPVQRPSAVVLPAQGAEHAAPESAKSETNSASQNELRKLIADRERLTQKIDDLCRKKGCSQQLIIHTEILEVDHSRVRAAGFDFTVATPGGVKQVDIAEWQDATLNNNGRFAEYVLALKKKGFATVLADPTIVICSGQPASLHVGGKIPLPSKDDSHTVQYEKFGTELDVLAQSMGNDRARLKLRERISNVDEQRGPVVDGQRVPTIHLLEFDTTIEVQLGKTQVLLGPVCRQNKDASEGKAGSETSRVTTTIVLVTVEAVEPTDPNIKAASALAIPRTK